MTEPAPLQQTDRTYVRFGNRKLSYFSGCDYFRLSSHPKVLEAFKRSVTRFGLNVAASRLTTGNHVLYGELEEQLKNFFRAHSALLVPTGYLTNLVVAEALEGRFSHALIDEFAHPSLQEAARRLECKVLSYKHQNPAHLGEIVVRCGKKSRLIVLTDGMFSHSGSVAPLRDYLEVLPKNAIIIVDDAHGAGVVGKYGRGTLEQQSVRADRIIQTITLSKAFGVYGGAVLASTSLRTEIIERSKTFIGSTPIPLPLAAAAMESLRILQTTPSLRKKLRENVRYLKSALAIESDAAGPIVSVKPEGPARVKGLKRALLAAGIYPPFIKYPGGPSTGYFRFVISSEHTKQQLDGLIGVLDGHRSSLLTKAG